MIYTSYFSSKKYKKEDGISIARYTKFWDGDSYPLLYPSANLLTWWKSIPKEAAKEDWFTEQYERAYFNETLSKLDPHKVAKDLEGKVLLCYEKSDDFCHRHLIANWLLSNGIKCEEIE
jgi:uncharacterized protein (DUF488 family)